MPATTRTYQLFKAIDNPVPVLIFQVQSLAESAVLEDAIRNGEWWSDPATPSTVWHLVGITRYDVTSP